MPDDTTCYHDVASLRLLAANYMRANPDEFEPFIDELPTTSTTATTSNNNTLLSNNNNNNNNSNNGSNNNSFQLYCNKVENMDTAEWGGHLELKALSMALQTPIYVYHVNAPILKMGEEYAENSVPLRLTYHRHFYSLGEHYNSTMRKLS